MQCAFTELRVWLDVEWLFNKSWNLTVNSNINVTKVNNKNCNIDTYVLMCHFFNKALTNSALEDMQMHVKNYTSVRSIEKKVL